MKQITKERFQETKDKTSQSWKDLIDGVKSQAKGRKEESKDIIVNSNDCNNPTLNSSQTSSTTSDKDVNAEQISNQVISAESVEGPRRIESLTRKVKDRFQSIQKKILNSSSSNSMENESDHSNSSPSSDSSKPPN